MEQKALAVIPAEGSVTCASIACLRKIQRKICYGILNNQPVWRDPIMCDALKTLMRPEMEAEIDKEVENARLENIKNLMETLKFTAQQVMEALKIPVVDQPKYAARL